MIRKRFGEAMATAQRLLSKFERDGYITLATPSSLPFTKKIPIPAGALDDEGSARDRAPSGLEMGSQNP